MDSPTSADNGYPIIPVSQYQHGTAEDSNARYVVDHAYCPEGCSILDEKHPINGYPGLRMGFSRSGVTGELVLSAVQGDFDKIVLSGELADGERYDLFCPFCGTPFATLVSCSCSPGAQIVIIGFTPQVNVYEGIAFCNVTGCKNEAFVLSGHVLQSVWANMIGRY